MMTKSKISKAIAAMDIPAGITVDIDSDTITVWYESDYDAGKAVADALAAALGSKHVMYCGGKFIVYLTGSPPDNGDYSDPSSKWHY